MCMTMSIYAYIAHCGQFWIVYKIHIFEGQLENFWLKRKVLT